MPLTQAAEPSQAALKVEAKVTEQDATATVLARVPHGTVQRSVLEKEHGRLIGSFDIAQPTSKDLTEG
jgi:hypothetical protein